jgi:hypothetical protein
MRIVAKDTLGLVVDFQDRLMPVINKKEEVVGASVKLIKGLHILDLPVVVTQQYTKGLGMTVPAIQEVFDVPFIYQEKISFSCMGEANIVDVIKEYNKNNVIICGVEAHICVLQTVIDLIDLGYQVIVVEDCVSSRRMEDKEVAIQRMKKEGAIITTYESILFELTEKAGTEKFREISSLVK